MKKGKSKGNLPSPVSGYVYMGMVRNYFVYKRPEKEGYISVKVVESSLRPIFGKANFWLHYCPVENRWHCNKDTRSLCTVFDKDMIRELEALLKITPASPMGTYPEGYRHPI